jgi:hypothetical protein
MFYAYLQNMETGEIHAVVVEGDRVVLSAGPIHRRELVADAAAFSAIMHDLDVDQLNEGPYRLLSRDEALQLRQAADDDAAAA